VLFKANDKFFLEFGLFISAYFGLIKMLTEKRLDILK